MVPLSATTSSTVAKRNAFLAALFLAILAVENTASMLARRYAVGVIKLQFSKNAVLAVNELMKMGFSVMMTARHIQSSSTSPRNFGARGRGRASGAPPPGREALPAHGRARGRVPGGQPHQLPRPRAHQRLGIHRHLPA